MTKRSLLTEEASKYKVDTNSYLYTTTLCNKNIILYPINIIFCFIFCTSDYDIYTDLSINVAKFKFK